MGARPTTRQTRDNDYSNIGITGRKTGITLPKARLDANGMEEMSQLFSPSPRKPSPLKKTVSAEHSGDEEVEDADRASSLKTRTPPSRSTRKSIPPKSTSPRKSGISGTARRSTAVDVLRPVKDKENQTQREATVEKTPVLRPTPAPTTARRFSPEKTPLRDVTTSRQQTTRSDRLSRSNTRAAQQEESAVESTTGPEQLEVDIEEADVTVPAVPRETVEDGYDRPADSNEDVSNLQPYVEDDPDSGPLPQPYDDEDVDQTFEPEMETSTRRRSAPTSKEPTVANSRRKRKSDAVETDLEPDPISSPAAKRAKRISDQSTRQTARKEKPSPQTVRRTVEKPVKALDKGKGKAVQKDDQSGFQMSAQQEQELNALVDKIRTRPGEKKSLYILRRETPAEDNATRTRSGRVSVKPLAYWRNERCVFGGSPDGVNLKDGARFPLNSIKEIIRTEEVDTRRVKGKKTKKGKSSKKPKAKSNDGPATEPDSESDEQEREQEQEAPTEEEDQYTEPWETEIGTYKGLVSVWDPEQQSAIQEEEEVDIAYAPGAIVTREVKDSTFKYAKLLSTRFFGSGLVELPPGAVKRPKNSRKMHMSFFCATGRVTVTVGPLHGPANTFSIGKGGFWQVPRGNQYSIQNDLRETATVFFSQACEPAPHELEQ